MIPRNKFLFYLWRYPSSESLSGLCITRKMASDQKDSSPQADKGYFERERESEDNISFLQSLSPKKNTFMELHRINPLTVTSQRFSEFKNIIKKQAELEQQKFIRERHEILGSDLACAHFIVFRGGRVKFEGEMSWIELNEDETCPQLPDRFVRNMYLHSIDASNTKIRYEGLDNFTNLTRLKWLSLRNCCYVDSWYLDRVTGEYSNSLEYLDLRDCLGVTESSLSCIFKLRKLKTLLLTNTANTRSFEFMCLLLEDGMPNLKIEGVNYINVCV